MSDEGTVAHDPYAVLRNPDYRWFIATMGLVTLGLQMQGVVVGWQVYDRTGDPLALGGVVYAWLGPVTAHFFAMVLMLAGFAGLLLIRYVPKPVRPREGSLFASLAEGLRFVFSRRLLLGAISLDLFAVLFGGAVAVLPVFAKEILNAGPQGLGALRAAPAVGSVLMGITLAHLPPLRRAGRTLLICVAAFGVAMIAFALSRSFLLSLLLLAASGAVDNVSVVLRATLLQTLTPEHMLGRVSSVNQVFIGSSNEIGAFESGLAARFMGLVPSVVFGGCMTLLVVALTSWKVPELRRMDRIG